MSKLTKQNIEIFFSKAEKLRIENNFLGAIEFYKKVLNHDYNLKQH